MLLKKELTEYNRYQAFAVHMAISLVIFFILLVCITQYWYPGILFETGNGWKAIAMIVGIDLILGPLLTLIVFNHNKTSLKFDLSVIALVQTAALIYGTWTIYQTRPATLVFMSDKFVTFYYSSIIGKNIYDLGSKNSFVLYHEIPEKNASFELNPEQFKPYDKLILEALDGLRAYGLFNKDTQSLLIPVNPHQQSDLFIEIDSENGSILSIKHIPLPQNASN